MAPHRQQVHLDAPVDLVWDLVGSPCRHPEWWPRVIEVDGERFEEGDEYAQVTKTLWGNMPSTFLLERLDNLRQVRMSCKLSGMYADWRLTPAQGGTFVELEMGMEPKRLPDRAFYRVGGRGYFRRWASESLDALRLAASGERRGARA
jgi:hypothetical protein